MEMAALTNLSSEGLTRQHTPGWRGLKRRFLAGGSPDGAGMGLQMCLLEYGRAQVHLAETSYATH